MILRLPRIIPLRLPRIFYGWWIVALTMAVNALSSAFYFQGMAIFFLPLQRELGIGRAAASLPLSIVRLTGGFQSLAIGAIVDRVGPNKVLFFAGLLGGLGFLLFSMVDSYLMYLLVFILVLSTAFQATPDVPCMTTVARWFHRKRAFTLTLAGMGYAVGGAALTPIVAFSVSEFGWRNTALVLGIIVWVVIIPLSTRLKPTPEAEGLYPDGADKPPPPLVRARAADPHQGEDYNLREAAKTRVYWQFAAGFGLRGMVWAATSIHIVAILKWRGIDESTAGAMIGLMSLFGLPMALFMSWLGDKKFLKHRVVAVGDFTMLLGLLLIMVWGPLAIWQAIIIFLFLSPNQGNWPLSWATMVDVFGRKHFAILRGSIQAIMGVLSVGSPFFAGWVFDQTQSYRWSLIPSVCVLSLVVLAMWFLPVQQSSAEPQAKA